MNKLFIAVVTSLLLSTSAHALTTEELVDQGNMLWSEGKMEDAEAQFRKALQMNPDSSLAHERLANLYLTQNKTSEAVEEFQNAINDNPEDARLFIGIAIAYLHQKYYQMAEVMVNQAIELDPGLANAQKLKQYIDAKQQRMADDPHDGNATNHSSPPHHMNANVQHGGHADTIPLSVQKSLSK